MSANVEEQPTVASDSNGMIGIRFGGPGGEWVFLTKKQAQVMACDLLRAAPVLKDF